MPSSSSVRMVSNASIRFFSSFNKLEQSSFFGQKSKVINIYVKNKRERETSITHDGTNILNCRVQR
jgi:hypothetical protein